MATTPTPNQDPRTVVKTTQRLWSDEVALTEAAGPIKPKDTAYEFSNDRRFDETPNPYEDA